MYHNKKQSLNETGSRICDIDHPALPLEPNNQNAFQNLFGIKYKDENKFWIRSISSYELCSCFGLTRSFKLKLAESTNLTSLL